MLESTDDLIQVVRRLTTKRLMELKDELDTRDFKGEYDLFLFSTSEICRFIGGDIKNVEKAAMESKLWQQIRNEVFVQLPVGELSERLVKFAKA
jgi:hypothetical protein